MVDETVFKINKHCIGSLCWFWTSISTDLLTDPAQLTGDSGVDSRGGSIRTPKTP